MTPKTFFSHQIVMAVKNSKFDADYKSGEKVARKFYNKVINIKVTKIVGFHLLVL
jgi:hypothetical protein